MEIDKIRFLLASYCCFSPVIGKLMKEVKVLLTTDAVPLSDTEIAILLGLETKEWLNKKDQVMLGYFSKDDDGAVFLIPEMAEKSKQILSSDVNNPEIKKIIDEIKNGFDHPLLPHQILVEYYKKKRGYDKQTDWDKMYFKQYVRISNEIIKKIGLETGIKVIDWMDKKYLKGYKFTAILQSYQHYWQETYNQVKEEQKPKFKISNEYTRE